MAHESCVTSAGTFTQQEQARFTDWLLRSLKERPDDFALSGYTITDRKTEFAVWTANGPDYVRLYRPSEVPFEPKYQRLIWDAVHQHRHRAGSALFNAIAAKMEANPPTGDAPAIDIPADDFDRTEPEVAKLRALVAAVVRHPTVTAACVGIIIGLGMAVSAFAG